MSSIMATEPRMTGSKRGLKRATKATKPKFLDITGWVCLVWLALLVFVAIFGKWLAPHDPQAIDQANQLLYPNADNLLGTDSLGRDIFSRVVAGVGPTLYGPLLIVVIAGVGGTVLAVVAAWWGGWVDAIVSRTMDIIFAFPGIILAVLAVAMLGRGMVAPVVALSIATIPMVGRIVRSTARRERAMPYISALQVQGAPLFSLWFKHLIPNIAPTVMVQSFVGFGYALLDLAAISFLGLGLQPPEADWGVLVSEGKNDLLNGFGYQSIAAALLVLVTVVAINLLGDRLARRFEGQS